MVPAPWAALAAIGFPGARDGGGFARRTPPFPTPAVSLARRGR